MAATGIVVVVAAGTRSATDIGPRPDLTPEPAGGGFVIRVAVAGSEGRMGQEVCRAVEAAPDLELAGRADPVLGTTVAEAIVNADVLVDFTVPDVALANIRTAVEAGVHAVVGTTGFGLEALEGLSGANVLVAPNFAIGAVLMMRFAAEAAAAMPAAEIIELHHDAKVDVPSGTAALTQQRMAAASGREVPVHSIRLPGLVAHQEVILGSEGETLTIRHDSIDRRCFMPGVLLAVRSVGDLPEPLTVGLDAIL